MERLPQKTLLLYSFERVCCSLLIYKGGFQREQQADAGTGSAQGIEQANFSDTFSDRDMHLCRHTHGTDQQ
ncbi:hypothetical protein [Nitrosomonas aestuarii]|uniref:hypothetical protein n=1 Tax=Nitrosomonas aestuarii TaxID=52441 RepID=UPI00147DC948